MALDPKKIGHRIAEIRGGRSRKSFGKLLGVSDVAVLNYEKGRVPGPDMLEKLSELDPEKRGIDWILTGRGTSARREAADLTVEAGPIYEVLKVEDRQERIAGVEEVEIRLVRVPILEDRIAAGPGRSLDLSRIEDWARVPRWKLKRGNSYYMLRVTGDSMEPQLRSGDLILVNLTRRDPARLKNKLVAAWLGDIEGATVKILQEDEKGKFWILRPRNPVYKETVVAKDNEHFQVAAVEAAWLNFE